MKTQDDEVNFNFKNFHKLLIFIFELMMHVDLLLFIVLNCYFQICLFLT